MKTMQREPILIATVLAILAVGLFGVAAHYGLMSAARADAVLAVVVALLGIVGRSLVTPMAAPRIRSGSKTVRALLTPLHGVK